MNAKILGKVKVGDRIPDFSAHTEAGEVITAEALLGQKTILYFYPKDNTPGCIKEACNLRDNYQYFMSKGYKIIGVSKDTTALHQKFIKKFNLPFPLIADPELNLLSAFGFYGPKKFMGRSFMGTYRTTVVFDEKGIITHIIYDVKTDDHSNQLKDILGL